MSRNGRNNWDLDRKFGSGYRGGGVTRPHRRKLEALFTDRLKNEVG